MMFSTLSHRTNQACFKIFLRKLNTIIRVYTIGGILISKWFSSPLAKYCPCYSEWFVYVLVIKVLSCILLKLSETLKLISIKRKTKILKEIGRAEHEYMNIIYPPPKKKINVLLTLLLWPHSIIKINKPFHQ